MDDLLIELDDEPVLIIELDSNPSITDLPDPYLLAVQNGYAGSKEQWLSSLFTSMLFNPEKQWAEMEKLKQRITELETLVGNQADLTEFINQMEQKNETN